MTISSFDALVYTTAFLIPGFVWSAVLSMLVARRAAETKIRFLEFLALSCINHGLWIWLTYPLFAADGWSLRPLATGGLLFLVVFISPVMLGLATGRLVQTEWVRSFLGRLGFRTIHPIPTAWDYKFSRTGPCWVIVTLKNGARVFGLFGTRSFAGDDRSERDIFLEMLFEPTGTGEWAPVEDTDGIIVKGDQIAAIEFRRLIEVAHGQEE